MATFGERLLLERRRLDVNQDDLAIKANVNRAYISNLERGHAENPSVAVVEAISKALGVKPEYLLGWTDDPLGEGSVISSATEGRIVYQVSSPGEYRAMRELLDIWPELTEDDRRFLLDLATKLGRAKNVRIIE